MKTATFSDRMVSTRNNSFLQFLLVLALCVLLSVNVGWAQTTTTINQVLRLQVSNGMNSDETIVFFNALASNGFDAYDSPKMTNSNPLIPEINTTVGDEQLAINGLNAVTPNLTLPLGFTPGQVNTFNIKATEISSFDAGTHIILKDQLLNIEKELIIGNDYSFTSDATPTDTRFMLIFRAADIATAPVTTTAPITTVPITDTTDQNVLVYINPNNQVTVNCSDVVINDNTISVYNALVGKKLQTKKMTNKVTVMDAPLTRGVYLVTVGNGKKSVSKKVIVS